MAHFPVTVSDLRGRLNEGLEKIKRQPNYPTFKHKVREVKDINIDELRPRFLLTPMIWEEVEMIQYLLWMLDRIEGFDKEEVEKAIRWVVYVYSYMEWLGLITNKEVRDLARGGLK